MNKMKIHYSSEFLLYLQGQREQQRDRIQILICGNGINKNSLQTTKKKKKKGGKKRLDMQTHKPNKALRCPEATESEAKEANNSWLPVSSPL